MGVLPRAFCMSIIFLSRSKKITIGPGKEASSPHILGLAGETKSAVTQIREVDRRSSTKMPTVCYNSSSPILYEFRGNTIEVMTERSLARCMLSAVRVTRRGVNAACAACSHAEYTRAIRCDAPPGLTRVRPTRIFAGKRDHFISHFIQRIRACDIESHHGRGDDSAGCARAVAAVGY